LAIFKKEGLRAKDEGGLVGEFEGAVCMLSGEFFCKVVGRIVQMVGTLTSEFKGSIL
jgi:hypothetical protein